MPPPSTPRAVTTNSAATLRPPAERRTAFTGAPKCRAIAGDQATPKPTFDGRNGASGTPSAARIAAQAPSDPSRAHEAPPSARTVAPATTARTPPGVAKRAAGPSQPVHRQRVRKATPAASSRRVQARSSGEAFIPTGKTRPELPVKVATPSPSAQAATSAGPKPASIGASQSPPAV